MEDFDTKVTVANADAKVVRKLNNNIDDLGTVIDLLGDAIGKSKLVRLMFQKYVKTAVRAWIFKEAQSDIENIFDKAFIDKTDIQNLMEDHRQNVQRQGGVEIIDGPQRVVSYFLKQKCMDNVKSSEEGATHIADAALKTKAFGNILLKLPWEWEIFRDTVDFSTQATLSVLNNDRIILFVVLSCLL